VIPSPERQAEILASMPNAIVATIRPDGTPQLTPNWYLWTGSSFLISVTERSIKTRHLRRDPRIVLCIDDVEGEAAREPTLALCRKYMAAEQVEPHWDALLAEGRRVVIEVKPVRYQWHDRAG
jgi:PPOX class probable F420-dependent enzyme